MSNQNRSHDKSGNSPSRSSNDSAQCGNAQNAPANARTVKSSVKTGTVSRSAARSAAKAISNGR
jgi:hypothetical protein